MSNTEWTEELTPREIEVLELARLTDEQIALALGCSRRTVTSHWENIRRKAKVASKIEAALDWYESKIFKINGLHNPAAIRHTDFYGAQNV